MALSISQANTVSRTIYGKDFMENVYDAFPLLKMLREKHQVKKRGGNSIQWPIEYKEYGIKLDFTPTVLDSELVNIAVKTEVSTLDYDNGVVLSGFAIPALISNKAQTTVEIKDGEAFVVGGMILNEVARGVSRIPVLGHIPVLGYLFSSHRYQNKETELLIMISPHIVQAMRPEDVPEIDMNPED